MKFKTAASIAALAMVSAFGLPVAAQAEPGTQVDVGPALMRVAGPISGQPPEKVTPTQAQPNQTAPPTQAQGQGAQKDQKQAAAIPARQPDMVLVSNLLNTSVYGPNGSTIGEVEDVLVKSDGKIEGLVVSVGGFLGIGEKNVALRMDRFQVKPEADGRARITASVTEDELRKAPEFKMKQGQAS
jgi:sporulation protein YlmC with PRC-barrel domain